MRENHVFISNRYIDVQKYLTIVNILFWIKQNI